MSSSVSKTENKKRQKEEVVSSSSSSSSASASSSSDSESAPESSGKQKAASPSDKGEMKRQKSLKVLAQLTAEMKKKNADYIVPDYEKMNRKNQTNLERTLRQSLGHGTKSSEKSQRIKEATGAKPKSKKDKQDEQVLLDIKKLKLMREKNDMPTHLLHKALDNASIQDRLDRGVFLKGPNPFSFKKEKKNKKEDPYSADKIQQHLKTPGLNKNSDKESGSDADNDSDSDSDVDMKDGDASKKQKKYQTFDAQGSTRTFTQGELEWMKATLRAERSMLRDRAEHEREIARHLKKRKQTDDRYKLPEELHIPQELINANPIANAKRLEKESKLFKYKRNAPNYAELVAKVRSEFLATLPGGSAAASTNVLKGPVGQGSASGADGNKATVDSGWDRVTKLVGEYHDKDGLGDFTHKPQPHILSKAAQAAQAAANAQYKQKKPAAASDDNEASSNASDDEDDGSKKKRSKVTHDNFHATAVMDPNAPLHQSYHPRFVSSFTWLPEKDLLKSQIDPLDADSIVSYTSSRMVQPGAPYPYLRPTLPLIFHPNMKGVEVDKPGVVAIVMAATRAGVKFVPSDEEKKLVAQQLKAKAEIMKQIQAAAASRMEDVSKSLESEDKSKKSDSKKKKKKNKDKEAVPAAADSSSSSSSIPPSIQLPIIPLRFVSYRNNFRKFFNRREFWRVDLQRVGHTVFLRRHLTYNYVNPFDVGHLFEQACKESNVIARAMRGSDIKLPKFMNGRQADSTTHPYRAIVQAKLREFELLTSIEIDLYEKSNDFDPFAELAHDTTSQLQSNINPLPTFLELKTVKKPRWDKAKRSDVWIQTFLGGIEKTVVGYKIEQKFLKGKEAKRVKKDAARTERELSKKKKASKKGKSAGEDEEEPQENAVSVPEIVELPTRLLIDPDSKEKLMQRFYEMLAFISRHIEEGKVYKLEHRKRPRAPVQTKEDGLVHPSRLNEKGNLDGGQQAAAVNKHQPPTVHGGHSDNWMIALEEIEHGILAQPVIADGLLERVQTWADKTNKQFKSEGASSSSSSSSKKKKKSKEDSSSSSSTKKKQKKEKKSKDESNNNNGSSSSSKKDKKDKKKDKSSKKKDKKSSSKKHAADATKGADSDVEMQDASATSASSSSSTINPTSSSSQKSKDKPNSSNNSSSSTKDEKKKHKKVKKSKKKKEIAEKKTFDSDSSSDSEDE